MNLYKVKRIDHTYEYVAAEDQTEAAKAVARETKNAEGREDDYTIYSVEYVDEVLISKRRDGKG